tara:strand:- start:2276 stop:3130 length:855 start_codon:yes stop_codon:yes gene_type:complete
MIYPKNWKNYELLDFGDGRKLERFGTIITDRPEPAATNKPQLSAAEWKTASLFFSEEKGQKGVWNTTTEDWEIDYETGNDSIHFHLRQTAFKHLGVFPEQAANWEFIQQRCAEFQSKKITPKVLNLFAYTGGASLAANKAGAEVTHVDSVKSVVNWARDNATLSGIETIRWIVEDARKFVEKSVRRGDVYHGVILDPPIFGLGPKGKNWKLNRDLPELLQQIMKILDPSNRFLILNTYSPQLPLSDLNKMLTSIKGFPNKYESTTLGLKSTSGKELELGNLIRF